jgi:hypothetical protein
LSRTPSCQDGVRDVVWFGCWIERRQPLKRLGGAAADAGVPRALLIEHVHGSDAVDEYRGVADPWTDMFRLDSRPRR